MTIEQDIDLGGIDEEQQLIERTTRALMDAVDRHGDGDVARGVIRAFDSGALDVPFAPSDAAAGAVLPARDDDGRVRMFEFGDLAVPDEIREIARLGEESRLTGLIFGPVDYTAELGGRAMDGERPAWAATLERLSNEASAAGLVCVGGPFDQLFEERAGVTYYNAPGYADQVRREATVGIDGSWSLHPKQTAQANRIHMPTTEELERDVGKIEGFVEAKAEGSGAVVLDGQMVDEATYKNFANTVATVRAIDDAHPDQTAKRYDEGLLERARDVDLGFE